MVESSLVLLDPTLDVVFKQLLTRDETLLRDMLEGILARPIGELRILNSILHGEQAADRTVIFDIHVLLDDGPRVDLEMQRQIDRRESLRSRLVFSVARDYSGQLRRGDSYHLLTPTIGIMWLVKPLVPRLTRLHSIFEFRERHENLPLTQQMVIHLLQLPYLKQTSSTGYTARVERWARFFAQDTENPPLTDDPIMRKAMHNLQQLSMDPEARRLARIREDAIAFHRMDLAASRAEGKAEGKTEGLVEGKAEGLVEGKAAFLSQLLDQRFGPLPPAIGDHIATATSEQLDRWCSRVLTAASLAEVLRP